MSSYNRVIQVGNLTRDIELRYTGSGMAVADVSIAVNDRVKKNDQWIEETSFFDWTLWGRTAEVANEYLAKGSSVLLEGKAKQDRWEKDGNKRTKVKFVCDRLQLLGSKDSSSTSTEKPKTKGEIAGVPAGQQKRAMAAVPDDDVPF